MASFCEQMFAVQKPRGRVREARKKEARDESTPDLSLPTCVNQLACGFNKQALRIPHRTTTVTKLSCLGVGRNEFYPT
ncbi:hypothetical protein KGM_205577 [Danaus plexippus plexippus]|uniref:Uncharacterized protein n=1 Tax=Danaus plexippus plexippus TaxID=278856 RepID=A0A212ENJ5_DANPL|nr:hypothetical protein KGM_205577 [Danaus plexippus plexippus]